MRLSVVVLNRRAVRLALGLAGFVALAVAAIAFSLRVTPTQSVSALGQTVEVGAADPTFSLSGPGVLDLFGQSMDTEARFTGPVRPRLVLSRITINRQVATLVTPGQRHSGERALGQQLASGWTRYFVWQVVFVAVGASVLSLAYVGIRRHHSWRRSLTIVLVAVALSEAVDLGWVMLTAYSAPRVLAKVGSISGLVGLSEQPPIAPAPGRALPGVQVVVLGDSTAAGLGNPPLRSPSAVDRACYRSADAYAVALAQANSWDVENLACSGATIEAGILGPQPLSGGLTAPAQLAAAKAATGVKTVFVSVGADDLNWDVLVKMCAAAERCDDAVSTAFFQSQLFQFTKDYYQLLSQLAAMASHPQVVVNQYYDPFDPRLTCLDHVGLTGAKQQVLVQRLDALNAVLAQGAEASGFGTAKPDFSGHELCTPVPYVQGLGDSAPFHPTAAGELAIALADDSALRPS